MCNKMLRIIYQKRQLFTKYILYRYKRRDYKDYIMAYQNGKVEAVNRTQAAEGNLYISTNFNTEQGLVSSTYGPIKQSSHEISTSPESVGLDPNVSYGWANAMSDPNSAIVVRGKPYFIIPNLGFLKPYNSDGNSAMGCSSLHLIG